MEGSVLMKSLGGIPFLNKTAFNLDGVVGCIRDTGTLEIIGTIVKSVQGLLPHPQNTVVRRVVQNQKKEMLP